MSAPHRSGYVALVGRPSVGKSSLLNALLGQKIAITADRKQTTRNRILGVLTRPEGQIVFLDTPGYHSPRHSLGESMVKASRESLRDADVALLVIAPDSIPEEDKPLLKLFFSLKVPVILLLNKSDSAKKAEMEELLLLYRGTFRFAAEAMVSARRKSGLDEFLDLVLSMLPEGPPYYDEDTLTDQPERLMAAEIVREKVISNTAEEVPHSVAVEVTGWKEREDGLIEISAAVYVERDGQKGIIIGQGGRKLKEIGTQARKEIETLTGHRVFLELWVKVRKGWRNNPRMLKELGYL